MCFPPYEVLKLLQCCSNPAKALQITFSAPFELQTLSAAKRETAELIFSSTTSLDSHSCNQCFHKHCMAGTTRALTFPTGAEGKRVDDAETTALLRVNTANRSRSEHGCEQCSLGAACLLCVTPSTALLAVFGCIWLRMQSCWLCRGCTKAG